MQSGANVSDPLLENLPVWKRELILRKRANARSGAGAATVWLPAYQRSIEGSTTTDFSSVRGYDEQQLAVERTVSGPYYCSLQGPNKQLAQRSVRGSDGILRCSADPHSSFASASGGGGARGISSCPIYHESGEECVSGALFGAGARMHHKGLYNRAGYCRGSDEDNGSLNNGDEDLQYGPGIVSKLKNRYLSLAMRETKSRPALRRFSSLEDLLDAEDAADVSAPRGRASGSSSKRDAMKRARSVDCLTAARRGVPMEGDAFPYHAGSFGPKSKSAGDALSSFSREDIIIIESSTNNQIPTTNGVVSQEDVRNEVKPPVTLDTIKSVFEPSSGGPWRGSQKQRPVGLGLAAKPITPTGLKPVPKAKPVGLTARRPDSIQEAKGFLKQVTQLHKASPRSSMANKVVNGDAGLGSSPTRSTPPVRVPPSPTKAAPSSLARESASPRLPVAPPGLGMRSEQSIESTRVLLENRKNAQKSRRDEVLKSSDLTAPKKVVLVETSSPVSPSSPPPMTPPPTLPLRNISAPSVAVPPAPPPRLSPTGALASPITSQTSSVNSPPILSTPSRQNAFLPILSPSHTSTPNQTPPTAGRRVNGLMSPNSVPSSPVVEDNSIQSQTREKPQAPVLISPRSPLHRQLIGEGLPSQVHVKPSSQPSSPVIETTTVVVEETKVTKASASSPANNINSNNKTKNSSSNNSVSQGGRPSTRPPSPPINPKHFVSLKATAPTITAAASLSASTSPAVSPSKTPPGILKPNNAKAQPTSSPSSVVRETSTDSPPSAVRSTKVTTFSSSSDEITEVIEAVNTVSPRKGTAKDRWHQEQTNSLVFNFVGKKNNTPDYIENDGVDISKRVNKNLLDSGYVRLPGYDDCDSSTDDWDEELQVCPTPLRAGEPPPPCPFQFLGAAVIIKGRSNLQRQPRSKKLSISFNDTATKTFEYPSEASMLEDPTEDEDRGTPTQASHGVGLSSYTPSKLVLGNSFELGVSRTLGSSPLPPTSKRPQPEGGESDTLIGEKAPPGLGEDYLRPAGEEETVTWSAGGTSDMLF